MRRRGIWPWPEPPLLKPLRPLAGSIYSHPFSSVPTARAGGVLRISMTVRGGEALEDAAPDRRSSNPGRPSGLSHFWKKFPSV